MAGRSMSCQPATPLTRTIWAAGRDMASGSGAPPGSRYVDQRHFVVAASLSLHPAPRLSPNTPTIFKLCGGSPLDN